MEQFEILKDLVEFNTIKDKENKQIINYISNYLKKYRFTVEHQGKYLIMSIGKNYKLGFLGHTDTVEYIEGWNSNPFELTEVENKLYGLGTCDMKGGISAMLEAVSNIDFKKLKYGMKLYFTFDEEINFEGINAIVESKEVFPEFMIFGEPTYNQIKIGTKGLLAYELNFKGKKAHSSTPEKGKSANMNAISFFTELREFYNKHIINYEDNRYEVPYTTMNIGILKGGSAMNSIPAECFATVDFRIAKNEHINMLEQEVNKLSEKYECTIKITDKIEPFINEIESFPEIKETANFMTEASIVPNSKKIILGAGPVTAHEVNEYITKESYKKLVKQYEELILKFCNGL